MDRLNVTQGQIARNLEIEHLNNPILLFAMAASAVVHSSPPPPPPPLFFFMYTLSEEFANCHDMYANRGILSFILINKEDNMTVKLSNAKKTATKATKAPAVAKKNNKKVNDKTRNYTHRETMGFLWLMEEIKPWF